MKKAKKEGKTDFTDDTEIWDNYSDKKTRVIPGEPGNIKITYPKDFGAQTFRIGLGTDLHRLVEGRPLILGGVVLPYDKGEDGHSDGDALLHAITDALLGMERRRLGKAFARGMERRPRRRLGIAKP